MSGSAKRCWHRSLIFGWIEIAERVSSGEIAVDFARPVDLQLAWWARDLGRACFLVVVARPSAVCSSVLVTVGFALPQSWTAYPLGLISLLLAVSISFMVRFLVNLIAFWTFDVRGFVGLYVVLVGPLCGWFVPVHLFPEWLRIIAYANPFPSMLQSPIDVLSGYALDMAAVAVVGTQLAWLVALVGLARLVQWRAAHTSWWCRVADQSGLIASGAYRTLIGSRVRSQLAYRTSFWLNVATSVAVGLVEFIELYVILANVP